MLELHRYFPAILLDLTWELESQLDVQRTHDGHHKVTVRANGPLAFKLINNSEFPERETSSTLIMYKSLRPPDLWDSVVEPSSGFRLRRRSSTRVAAWCRDR